MSNDTKNSADDAVFVVIRNGFRVSSSEYTTRQLAEPEYDYWNRLLTNWPDGSHLRIHEFRRERRVTTQEKTT